MSFVTALTVVEIRTTVAGKYIVGSAIQADGQGGVFKARTPSNPATDVPA
jgi:hypothetical protein